MKKLITIILSLLIIVSLTGCTISENPTTTETLDSKEFHKAYEDPESYIGIGVEFKGKIFIPVSQKDGKLYIQAFSDIENQRDNVMISFDTKDLSLEPEDIIEVKGTISGTAKGTNGFGEEISVPIVEAESITKVN